MKMKVGYSTTIPVSAYGIKDNAWCEIEVEDGREFAEVWGELKEKVDAAVKEKYPHIYNGKEQPQFAETLVHQNFEQHIADIKPTSKEEAIQSHITTINECKTINNLMIFTKLVEKTNHPDLTAAYQTKLKTFEL